MNIKFRNLTSITTITFLMEKEHAWPITSAAFLQSQLSFHTPTVVIFVRRHSLMSYLYFCHADTSSKLLHIVLHPDGVQPHGGQMLTSMFQWKYLRLLTWRLPCPSLQEVVVSWLWSPSLLPSSLSVAGVRSPNQKSATEVCRVHYQGIWWGNEHSWI